MVQTVAGSPTAIRGSSVSRKSAIAYQAVGFDQTEQRTTRQGEGTFRNLQADHDSGEGRPQCRQAQIARRQGLGRFRSLELRLQAEGISDGLTRLCGAVGQCL
jgi:hypothetical protein